MELPLLIMAGADDPVTPPGMAEQLFEIALTEHKTYVLIEDGGHNDLPQHSEYTTALRAFYADVFNTESK